MEMRALPNNDVDNGGAEKMMLGFVGCGAALYPELYNSNGFFRIDRDLFLLDCGETSFRQHYMAGHFRGIQSVTVFLTHMHADHMGSLGTLVVYCYLKLGIKTTIVFPDTEKLSIVLNLTGVEPEHYRLISEYDLCGDSRVSGTAVPVKHHDSMVKAFGYLLSYEGKVIYYSGDAGEFPDLVRDKLLKGEIDEVYQDTSVEDHGEAHVRLCYLEERIPEKYRSKVYCMHYDGDYLELIREKGFQTIEKGIPASISKL